ncbi:hypothetical protein Moror_8876 [Moniliophthora roreri MCA 2997]|uniref:Secreted protein n=2 Tax=Moniliophthora roreri TaxID=221103 RepID=V2XJR1_MONRO|nr:hypothetical protein Moror_8876 [Moniliophthora roreri MCA 2997]KAI3604729.1 hypothetical protein WG66_008440 [Moniliophthora roreri]
MFTKQLATFLIVLFCGLSVIAAAGDECSSVSKTHIGEKQQVLFETKNCGGQASSLDDSKVAVNGKNSESRNVCGAQCDTVCYTTNKPPYYIPSDCQVIYDAIWYESQRNVKGHEFTIRKGHTVSMSYSTCKVSFVNEGKDLDLVYCRNDWGAVIKFIATSGTCPLGGKCVAQDKSWTIVAIGVKPIQGN